MRGAKRISGGRINLAGRLIPTYETGDFIKAEFADETRGVGEWMWVRVHRCDDARQIVFGTLDNVPINDVSGKLTFGTELAISFAKIREHKKPWDFDSKN